MFLVHLWPSFVFLVRRGGSGGSAVACLAQSFQAKPPLGLRAIPCCQRNTGSLGRELASDARVARNALPTHRAQMKSRAVTQADSESERRQASQREPVLLTTRATQCKKNRVGLPESSRACPAVDWSSWFAWEEVRPLEVFDSSSCLVYPCLSLAVGKRAQPGRLGRRVLDRSG